MLVVRGAEDVREAQPGERDLRPLGDVRGHGLTGHLGQLVGLRILPAHHVCFTCSAIGNGELSMSSHWLRRVMIKALSLGYEQYDARLHRLRLGRWCSSAFRATHRDGRRFQDRRHRPLGKPSADNPSAALECRLSLSAGYQREPAATSLVRSPGVNARATGPGPSEQTWSIDLPHPLDHQLHGQTCAAVSDACRTRWSYLEGSSDQRLPPLVAQIGHVEVSSMTACTRPGTRCSRRAKRPRRCHQAGSC